MTEVEPSCDSLNAVVVFPFSKSFKAFKAFKVLQFNREKKGLSRPGLGQFNCKPIKVKSVETHALTVV